MLLHVLLLPLAPAVSQIGAVQTLFLLGLKIPLALPGGGHRLRAAEALGATGLSSVSCGPWCPPGLWLQRITTREPSDDQLEIALLALERALAREEGRPRTADGVQVYPDFPGALAA